MAKFTGIKSDLTGQIIDRDCDHVRIRVSHHAELERPVTIDASIKDVQALVDNGMDAVVLIFHAEEADLPASHVIMKREDFEGQFVSDPAMEVLQAAKPASEAQSDGSGVNYRLPENAGIPHRGQVTAEEKAFVRANLDQANANRKRVGKPAIDLADPKECAKYGLDVVVETPKPRPAPAS